MDKIRLPTKLYVDDRDDNVIKVIELSTKRFTKFGESHTDLKST